MKSKKSKISPNPTGIWRAGLVRAVAIFFLLFTGADLLAPQYFCGAEEAGGLRSGRIVASADSREGNQDQSFLSAKDDGSQPEKPSPETPGDEDCFCCCAHVLATISVSYEITTEIRSLPVSSVTFFIPAPPLRGTYHPPRIA